MKTNLSILIAFLFMATTACKKEGSGGKSSVSGNVQHHGANIANAVVYIKYGATEFPGADVSLYDDKTTSNGSAYYEFKSLRRGNYFLYAVGFDNSVSEVVSGGIAVKLMYNKSAQSNIPVTE
jgi:hypothetical protein